MRPGDEWRIVYRRWMPLFGNQYQPCVFRGKEIIPLGPSAATAEELRQDVAEMIKAFDKPVIDEDTGKDMP